MKKTVANRRMFRQGGAVNSGPTGILASSPSLIDAVAQDAMNVQGGSTVRMAEGGIVRRMANGGFMGPSQNPAALPAFLNPPPLRALPSPVTAVEATMKPRSERLSGEELLNLSLGARTILPPEISDEIIEYPATPVRPGQSSLPPSTVMRSNIDDPVYDMETLTEEYLQGDPDNVVKEYLRSIAGTPAYGKIFSALQDAEMQAQQSGEVPTTAVPLGFEDFKQQDVDPEMGTSDVIGPRVDDPTASDTVGEPGEEGGGDEVSVPKTAKGPAFNEGVDTVMGPGDEFEDPNAMKRRTETPGVGAEAVKQIKDAAKSGNEEETKNKLEDYINEFKSAIPEYEGKSEAEKGFDLVKMGMAVAAGESPEAITNISKGVLATIDNFTEDEKAKRAYKQQVAMSAAKYGLQRVAKDRDNALALAKEGRKMPYKLIANKDFEFEGRKIKKGQAFPLTRNQIDAGLLQDLPLTYEDSYVSDAKANLAAVKASLKGRINATSFNETKKQYLTDLDDFKSGIRMKGVLREAANIAADPNSSVTGIGGVFKDAIDSSLNAMGIQGDERGAFLRKFSSDDRKTYNAKQRQLGTLMATKLLREGSKTLSDFDRQRVDELIGLMVGTGDTLFASDKVLKMKLIELEKSIEAGIQGSANSLRMTEELFNNEITKGGTSIAAVLQRTRQRGLGEASGAALRSSKQGSILVSDIYDFKTKKFKPSYLRGKS